MAWFSIAMRGRRVVKKGSAMAWQGIALRRHSIAERSVGNVNLCDAMVKRCEVWQGYGEAKQSVAMVG